MNSDFGKKQQCQQILNRNAGAQYLSQTTSSSYLQSMAVAPCCTRRCSRWSQFVVPDLVGEQCNQEQPCIVKVSTESRRAVLHLAHCPNTRLPRAGFPASARPTSPTGTLVELDSWACPRASPKGWSRNHGLARHGVIRCELNARHIMTNRS